jgi:cytochrome c oxidase assembly protein subunit 15
MSANADAATSNAIRTNKGVGIWLFVIAALIGLMVVVGGLTRLTGSGLSITEWQPITGAWPPTSEADWQSEFAKYKGTPQYELINQGMGLAGFKAIYWWEWSHRLLGRILGFVFALPFVFFLWRRRIDRTLVPGLVGIFLLGGAQGALGWWMVQSGLEPSRVAVSQYRLAAHLGLAIILFGFTLWNALSAFGATRTANAQVARRYRGWAMGLCALIFVQMLLGAFMSGIDAGHAFNTWPDYAGAWIPPGLYDLSPWWINHFENQALVHFQHRTVAYAVLLLVLYLYMAVPNAGADRPAFVALFTMMGLTLTQFVLGIVTVVTGVPLAVAALHQICALMLFGASVWLVFALTLTRVSRRAAA